MRVIPFEKTFAGTEKENRNLVSELKEELPGILNWAIAGYQKLLSFGLQTSPECETGKRVKTDSMKENNPEELFFDEHIERQNGERVKSETVYNDYCAWYASNGYQLTYRLNQKEFSKRLGIHFGIQSKTLRLLGGLSRGFEGIKIRDSGDV